METPLRRPFDFSPPPSTLAAVTRHRSDAPHTPRPAPRATSSPVVHSDPLERVYGLRAATAVLAVRPRDVVELCYDPTAERSLSDPLRAAREAKVKLRPLDEAALRRQSGTHNHEGVLLWTRPRSWLAPSKLPALLEAGCGAAIALDRVRNGYNIGAILRTAAFFALDAALFGSRAPEPALPEDAVRVAEGGAEHLALSRTTDLAETLSRLRAAGVQVIGAESDGARDAVGFDFAPRVVLVLGHEREGLSERVRAQCDALVAFRGAGTVRSLNVAVAAGLMISELVRARTKAPRSQDARRSSQDARRPSRDRSAPRGR
jgi:TrmH RNA methyltransferase